MISLLEKFFFALRSPMLVRYLIIGVLLNGLGYVLFVFYQSITSKTVYSVFLSSCCLFPISFWINKYYVYQNMSNMKDRINQLKKFALMYAVFGISNIALVSLAINFTDLNHLLIQFSVLALLVCVNFFVNFFWIFKPKKVTTF